MPPKAFDAPKGSKPAGAKRAILREVPVGAHWRQLAKLGLPEDEPLVEKMSSRRLDKMPPTMQEQFIDKSQARLEAKRPKPSADGIPKRAAARQDLRA